MINKLNLDHIWVLKQLQSIGYKSAIIAGGAVRDTLYRKRISDIDIYIWDDKLSTEKVLGSNPLGNKNIVKKLLGLEEHYYSISFSRYTEIDDDILLHSVDCFPAYYQFSNQITQIVNVLKDGIRYQLISTALEPIEFVNRKFGIYLSRCYCDGTKMRYTNEFLIDHINKTLTLDGDFSLHEYKYMKRKYLPKMKRKFPNYIVIDKLRPGLIAAYKKKKRR